MSQENVEIVRRTYQALPNLETVRDLYRPDYEMDLTDIAPDIGVVRGFDQNLEALRPYFETFEDFHVEIEEVIHADEEQVVTAVRDGGRMRGRGSEVRNHRVHVWTFRNGRVVRFSSHLDRNQALEAAGLRE
jgi:ketosteroid isomerase-like protein